MTALPLILTVFVACAVEAIEALTIVLAAGLTREWRSTFQGMAVALAVLAAIVAALGPTITLLPLTPLQRACARQPEPIVTFNFPLGQPIGEKSTRVESGAPRPWRSGKTRRAVKSRWRRRRHTLCASRVEG